MDKSNGLLKISIFFILQADNVQVFYFFFFTNIFLELISPVHWSEVERRWLVKTGPETKFNNSRFYKQILENEAVLNSWYWRFLPY